MPAPLAGKPPFATDMRDSYYENKEGQTRRKPSAPAQDNSRTSAYDVYDNYLTADNPSANRNSGVGAAFMNGDMDDSDSEDEDLPNRKPLDPHHTPVSIPVPEPGKNAALAAATGARQNSPTPPPQYRPQQPAPATIAAPRPGYAAPISALSNAAQPEPRHVPPGIQVLPNNIAPASPSPTSPHPLQAPITPIQPVFARPRPPKDTDVKFAGEIMRGEKESGILPKRGERGDDFWRRFSMVVKDERSKRDNVSPWLRKNQSGSTSWARWIWVVGIILVIAAAGGIGIGWYLSHKQPDHYQPTAIGGSANEVADVSTSVKQVGSEATATAHSSLRVQPTNTVARRDDEPLYTPSPLAEKREPTAIPEVVKIQPQLPKWMQSSESDDPLVQRDNMSKMRRRHDKLHH